MTNTHSSVKISSREILFEVQINWLEEKRGVVSANDVEGTIYVATPQAFGGEGQEWSPEHLFLSSISSCFMSTYLVFAKKAGVLISRFECKAVGKIELVNGKYQFTVINVFPKVYLADVAMKEKASDAAEKTKQYCLISNSIKSDIIYNVEILKDPNPRIFIH